MNAISLQEAQRDLGKIVDRVIADAEPIIIKSENGRETILIPIEEYNAWKETTYLLSNRANAEHLRRSVNEARSGDYEARKLIDPRDDFPSPHPVGRTICGLSTTIGNYSRGSIV